MLPTMLLAASCGSKRTTVYRPFEKSRAWQNFPFRAGRLAMFERTHVVGVLLLEVEMMPKGSVPAEELIVTSVVRGGEIFEYLPFHFVVHPNLIPIKRNPSQR